MSKTPDANNLWFKPEALATQADSGAYQRGRALYSAQKVLDLSITAEDDCWRLDGDVQGTQKRPYTVSVELTLTPEGALDCWDSDCTCPVGYDCKHGVALTIKAAYQGLRILGPDKAYTAVRSAHRAPPTPEEIEAARAADQARHDEADRVQAESLLLNWLHDLDRAADAAPPTAPNPRTPNKAPEQFLYLLKPTGSPPQPMQLQMEAVVSSARVNGGWTKPKAIRTNPTPA
jgi:hypothetical protein